MKLSGIKQGGRLPHVWAIGLVLMAFPAGMTHAQSGPESDPVTWAQSNFPSTGRSTPKWTSIKVGVNGESKNKLANIVSEKFGEPTTFVEGNPVWYLPVTAAGQGRAEITAIYFHPDNGNLVLDRRSSAERGEPLRLIKKKKVKFSTRPATQKQKSAPVRKHEPSF